MSNNHLTDIRYDSFDLDPLILKGLNEVKFEFCTPIQAKSLPIALTGKDVAGEAQTGTGKTAAFLVATFQHLLKNPAAEDNKQPRALLLAPTRELAIQIHKDALAIGKHTGLKFGLAYGGTGYESQRKQIEDGIDLLIGTPGRIIDYFKQHVFNLKTCQVVVLDEADRMFDLGFIQDIRYLLTRCPEPSKRLSLLFSATLSHRIGELAYSHMDDPEEVRIEADTKTADKVKQTVYYPANDEKIPLLLGLMKSLKTKRSIVFINTKRVAENVDAWLEGNGIKSALLSGDVPQKKRQTLLKKFQDDEFSVLVATDVAARGLHIPDVSHVFNYDLPQSGEDYVHRVGRTARAGASGAAISFACEDFAHYLMDIEEYIGHRVNNEPVSAELLVKPEPRAKRERRPRPGHRGGHSGGGNRPRHQHSR
jgi:ATP-dependent RNA helicase RhlB